MYITTSGPMTNQIFYYKNFDKKLLIKNSL